MEKLMGIGASNGIAIGALWRYVGNTCTVKRYDILDPEAELVRLDQARRRAIEQLEDIHRRAVEQLGEADAAILEIHAMLLEDPAYLSEIDALVRTERINAEYAVEQAGQRIAAQFAAIDDEYLCQRAADIRDVSQRLIRELTGDLDTGGLHSLQGRVVLATEDLMPSETVLLDKSKVLAFITRSGSKLSHSAILARTMGIPAVVALGDAFDQLPATGEVLVDGSTGAVFLDPDAKTKANYAVRKEQEQAERRRLQALRGQPSVTLDGVRVEINANIGHPDDLELVLENDAEGIGLFRSEFLYMESDHAPTEEEQLQAYRVVLERMQGKRVIVRTLDAGADKNIPYLNLPPEANPAMGFRAIRVCLACPGLFLTQLRALLRAGVYGPLGIMVPMIATVEEVLRVKVLLEEAKQQLAAEGLAYSEQYELGIMIETPAAALISDLLARHVDFFSIGTNDLTQYTLAVDRLGGRVGELYDPGHPAVLRLMRRTAENARARGIWTGVCGESAADTELIPVYLAMGITELSVPANAVLGVRACVRALDLESNRQTLLDSFVYLRP